jgi:hypothetical protein
VGLLGKEANLTSRNGDSGAVSTGGFLLGEMTSDDFFYFIINP